MSAHIYTLYKLTAEVEPFILLSHIPLHKPIGCVDKPLIHKEGGLVTKQNHLSPTATRHLLDYVAPDVILTGHDHHGCNYNHTNNFDRAVAEYTIRSIMGDFSGTGALLEFHLDNRGGVGTGTWVHSFKYCHFAPFRLLTSCFILQCAITVFALFYFSSDAFYRVYCYIVSYKKK